MWIQWSLTRFVRWRVRDWASCFTACRFPLDDETDGYPSSKAPPQRMVFDMKDESKGRRIAKKLLRRNRSNKNNKCTRINLNSTVQAAADQNTSSNDSSWPHIADEDYIVFCFREDGAFDVIKDCKSEAAPNRIDSTSSRSSWPVNQKVNYGEEVKRVDNSSHVERSNEVGYNNICPTSDQGDIFPIPEAEEEEVIYLDAESSSSRNRTRYHSDNQEIENQALVSITSSTDSNHSDNSTGSFAFPVLSWEWMGSPAQMPKSEGLHSTKHKSISLSFQCCRF